MDNGEDVKPSSATKVSLLIWTLLNLVEPFIVSSYLSLIVWRCFLVETGQPVGYCKLITLLFHMNFVLVTLLFPILMQSAG